MIFKYKSIINIFYVSITYMEQDEPFNLNLKTAITTEKPVFDINDKFLPHGNYFFTINSLTDYGTSKGRITVENETHEYEFKNFTIIKMMAKSQSRLFRRTSITHLDMPRYNSPSNSPSVFHNYVLESPPQYQPSAPPALETREQRVNSSGSITSMGSSEGEHAARSTSPIIMARVSPKTEERKNGLWVNTREPDTCSICLEYLVDTDRKTFLSCRHVFHRKCIRQWEKTQKKHLNPFYCPNCKAEVRAR